MKRRMEADAAADIMRSMGPPAPRLTQPRSHISSLPIGVFEIVFRLVAVRQDPTKLYPTPFDFRLLHRSLAPFALVSRDWRGILSQIITLWSSHVAYVDVNRALSKNESPRANASSAIVTTNPTAVDLRLLMRNAVTMNEIQDANDDWYTVLDRGTPTVPLRDSPRVIRSLANVSIDWNLLLQPRISTLVRLDLSEMPLDSVHLGSVLYAASTTCLQVRVLCLPKQTPRYSEDNEARETNMNELYGALMRWHRTNGGLLHLRIPFGRFDENTAIRLLRALVAYCPQIEYLDGWQDTYQLNASGQASCEAFWPAPAALWAKFWACCTHLRAFNMVMMPFDDMYLAAVAFAKNPKLESFVVAIDSAKARHHEVSRSVFPTMSLAWESLRFLRVEIPVVSRDVWSAEECVSDQFMGYLAIQCPHLRELRIQCADPRVLFTIGDTGLQFLKRLEHLEVLELQRLRQAPQSIVYHLFQSWPTLRLSMSFVGGQYVVWNLLRVLADSKHDDSMFTASLTRIIPTLERHRGIEIGGGIRTSDLTEIVNKISSNAERESQIHVHTMTRVSTSDHMGFTRRVDEEAVDLAHLELNLDHPGAFGWFRRQARFGVQDNDSHPCSKDCLAPGVVETWREPQSAPFQSLIPGLDLFQGPIF